MRGLSSILIWTFVIKINLTAGLLHGLNLTGEWKSLLDTEYRLSGRNIQFPCESTKSIYKSTDKYHPKNIIITRVQFHKYDAFVAMPRYKDGVPVTLGKVKLHGNEEKMRIQAFPDWSQQSEGDCEGIQSAIDIHLDKEHNLWVLDEGTTNVLDHPNKKCPPKVVAINILTHHVHKSVDLSEYVKPKSTLQYLVTEKVGHDDYIYISDVKGAIIMVNTNNNEGRRLVLPAAILKTCIKSSALYLSIVMKADHKYYLYFTYAGCNRLYAVETTTLHDGEDGMIQEVGALPDNGVIFCGTDGLSKLFFRRKDGNEIYMWDTNDPCRREYWSVVQRGQSSRQVTHVTPGPWKLIWALESNVKDYVANKAGSFGPSTIIHPIGKDVDDKPFRLLSHFTH